MLVHVHCGRNVEHHHLFDLFRVIQREPMGDSSSSVMRDNVERVVSEVFPFVSTTTVERTVTQRSHDLYHILRHFLLRVLDV